MSVKKTNKFGRFWKLLGPGLITGSSDDDPSGIATYSQAGAAYGLSTLWTAVLAFPLMAAIQQMCARIGLVTEQGLTGALKKNYPNFSSAVIFFSRSKRKLRHSCFSKSNTRRLCGSGSLRGFLLSLTMHHAFAFLLV